jgi:GGDEF domain-containing protein
MRTTSTKRPNGSATPRSKTTSAAKTAAPSAKASPACARSVREKKALVASLQGLGLLADDAAERLEQKADKLTASDGDALAQASGWDHSLSVALKEFSADGGDARASDSLHALIVWYNALDALPATEEGLREALVALKRAIPHDGASIYLRDSDAGTVAPFLHHGIEVELIGRIRFTEGQGFSSWVAGRRRPVLYTSVHRNEAPTAVLVRSFMAVPLVVGSDCLGVLQIGSVKDGYFTPRTLRVAILAVAMLAGLVQRYIARRQLAAREIRDTTTGLATPDYLRLRLDEEVARCRELGHSMSVVSMRLAGLDAHVERFGPEYRDRCRAELAGLVGDWRGSAELVAIDSSGKILAILPSLRRDRAGERTAALVAAVEKHNFPRRKRMSLLAGISAYPADADDAQGLLTQADNDLYESTRVGLQEPAALETVALS